MKITRFKDRVIVDGEGMKVPFPFEIVTVPEDDPDPIHLVVTGFDFTDNP